MSAEAKSGHSVIIANDLRTGRSVYLTADSGWSDSISSAQMLDENTAAVRLEEALADERSNLVIDPYLIGPILTEVDQSSGSLEIRERIRVSGPTIYYSESHREAEAA